MAVGYESQQVNSQLVNVAPAQGFVPLTFGSAYTGPGHWPRNGVFNVPPVTPAAGTTGQGPVGSSGVTAGNGSPSPTAGAMTGTGGVNWLHPTKSPLVFAFVFLAAGLLMLHKIHFRE